MFSLDFNSCMVAKDHYPKSKKWKVYEGRICNRRVEFFKNMKVGTMGVGDKLDGPSICEGKFGFKHLEHGGVMGVEGKWSESGSQTRRIGMVGNERKGAMATHLEETFSTCRRTSNSNKSRGSFGDPSHKNHSNQKR